MKLKFSKYHGTGNDFILVDDRDGNILSVLTQQVIAGLCRRHTGIGADGMILMRDSAGYDFSMKYYNSDGIEGTMCGNGGRCLVAFAQELGMTQSTYQFEAIDGPHQASLNDGIIELEMQKPFGYVEISPQEVWIQTGSPHFVSIQNVPVEEIDVYNLGRNIRTSESFAEEGTNVNFVNEIDERTLRVRTYERGVEDETLSCGTGAVAVVYTYLLKKGWPHHDMLVQTLGGDLKVIVEHPGEEQERVLLSGPAIKVFDGRISL